MPGLRMPHLRSARRTVAAVLALVVALFAVAIGTGTAQAHAAYKSSTPAANSVLTSAPATVSITFVQKLDPKGLAIAVYGKNGEVVSTGQAQISATDPYTATIGMKGDDSDVYRVDWQNTSAEDGDSTLGAFVFAVDPSGKSDKVEAATTTGTSQSAGSSSSGVAPVWAVLIGILGLVIGAGGTYAATRTRAGAKVGAK